MEHRAVKSIFLSFALLGSSSVFGANVTLGTANDGNCYPFNCNDSGSASGQSIHYQQVFNGTAFGSMPVNITAFTFSDLYLPGFGFDPAPFINGQYSFSFGVTSAAVGSLSPNLASNATFGLTGLGSVAGDNANHSSLTINGFTPFLYDPATGNLLLDIVVTNQALITSGSYSPANGWDADDTGTVTSRAYQIGTLRGVADSTGLVTSFDFTKALNTPEPATYTLFGAGLLGLLGWKRRRALPAVAAAVVAVVAAHSAYGQPAGYHARSVAIPAHTLSGQGFSGNTNAQVAVGIPTFVRTYSSRPQTFVGTDPASTNGTSTIIAPVVPIVLVLNNGAGPTFDPTKKLNTAPPGSALSALLATVTSPLFQNANYVTGGTTVGTATQFGDAIQRATFWDSVSTTSPNWHVRLQYQIKPAVTLNVPVASGSVSGPFALVDVNWLAPALDALSPNYGGPSTFPIFLVYEVLQTDNGGASCCILGYHTAINTGPSSIQTYAMGTYVDPFQIGSGISDVSVLSHEVSEWLNDPYVNNIVQPWPAPFSFVPPGPPYDNTSCQNDLETGDPIEDRVDPNAVVFHITTAGRQYTLQNQALAPWFLQINPSFSVNGYYTYLGPIDTEFTAPAPFCGTQPTAAR